MSGLSEEVQGSTKNLLQAILAHTQGLPSLPTNAFLALRLEYYDEASSCLWLLMGTILVHQPCIYFRSNICLFPPKLLKMKCGAAYGHNSGALSDFYRV